MTNLRTIRRLASEILKCGKNKVWLDPNENLRLTSATTRSKVAELCTDNLIIRKPNTMHSRYHIRKRQAEVAKGRHRGPGKVRGSKNAIVSEKKRWMRRVREMRGTLKEMRGRQYLVDSEYRSLYKKVKGNMFKSNAVMIEFIEKKKRDEKRMRELEEQAEALKMKI
ncbi:60S ribosomal protein L19 [Conglomerata obtusa]